MIAFITVHDHFPAHYYNSHQHDHLWAEKEEEISSDLWLRWTRPEADLYVCGTEIQPIHSDLCLLTFSHDIYYSVQVSVFIVIVARQRSRDWDRDQVMEETDQPSIHLQLGPVINSTVSLSTKQPLTIIFTTEWLLLRLLFLFLLWPNDDDDRCGSFEWW